MHHEPQGRIDAAAGEPRSDLGGALEALRRLDANPRRVGFLHLDEQIGLGLCQPAGGLFRTLVLVALEKLIKRHVHDGLGARRMNVGSRIRKFVRSRGAGVAVVHERVAEVPVNAFA